MFATNTGIVSILFYVAAWFYLLAGIKHLSGFRGLWMIPAVIALILHGNFLFITIDKTQLQNLAWPNLLSVTVWLAGIIVTALSGTKKIQNLVLIIFPLAMVAILAQYWWPGKLMVNTSANLALLVHIILSIFAMAASLVALAQALLLAGQNYLLHRQVNFRWLMLLPPVEAMESLLFNLIIIAFLLLTCTLISALWLLHGTGWAYLLPKAILSLVAWIVFGILLFGRYRLGWRGKIAIKCTLTGFLILVLVYFETGFFI